MSHKHAPKKILIADDHAVVRRGLKQILTEGLLNVTVSETADGFEAEQLAMENQYDVIVLDISLPGKNGLDILKQLVETKNTAKILMLSIYPEDQYGIRVIKAGASGFLNKDSAPEELIDAVNTLLIGRKYVTAKIAEQMVQQLSGGNKQLHETLSDREFQVMQMLADGKTVSEIAEQLILSPATINTYRARVLNKLSIRNHAELTRYVMELGLISV
ncbi:MAG: response regulator transcription factor [Bacteroidota bacterium]